jgi:PAS domain S-box-containing protein
MAYRKPISPEELNAGIAQIDGWRSGFDLISDQVVIADADANILYANKATEDNTGYKVEEIIGKTPGDLWGGEMSKKFYDEMWNTIKVLKKPWIGQVENKRKDGGRYWSELRISPVVDEMGNLKVFIAIEPNVTAHKEKELRDKIETLEKLNSYMLDREVKMSELKKEIETLKSQLSTSQN